MKGKGRRKRHTGFWVNVDDQPAHILGDPEMSEEEMKFLEKMIRAVHRMLDKKEAEKKEDGDHE